MKTQCPNCKARFNVDDKFAGKQAKCPKCTKPFTIQPFIETPAAVEPPVKRAEPAEPPAKSAEPAASPAKIASPVVPPALSGVASAKSDKSPEPVKTPIKKLTAEHAETAEKKPKTISANSAVSAVESVSKTPIKSGLSKIVFVYCWMAVRIIAGVLGGLGLMLAIRKEPRSTLIMAFASADVFLVCSVVIELLLFYKMWAAIADDQASITPAKAVGFLFVPVFNIYWALCMLTGFVEDYNSFIHRRSIKTKDLPFMLFLIYAFAFILAALVVTLPMVCVFAFIRLISRAFIGYPESAWVLFALVFAAGVAHFIIYILVAIKTCNAINALPQTKGG
jgi:predicted Zn finger-like uncharacterized protein